MQTKSPLVRIASIAGVALAIVALFVSLKIQHHAISSQSITSNHTAVSTQPATAPSAAQKENFARDYGKLPLAFEVNQGQTAPEVRYLAHGPSYQLFLTNQEAVLTLRQTSASGKKSAKGASLLAARAHRTPNVAAKTSVLRMHFDGANPAAEIAGTKLLPGKTNYFIGNDPKKWHTDVPSYEAVRYQGIYPGVDMLFYGKQQRLEYDFIVAPGADPKAIALSIAGARKLELNSQGDVLMSVAGSKVALQKPVIYQEINGERREIAGNYTIANDRQIRFSVAAYDHTQPLTIDPVLIYSTYIGGEAFDQAFGIALDAAGDAYIAGHHSRHVSAGESGLSSAGRRFGRHSICVRAEPHRHRTPLLYLPGWQRKWLFRRRRVRNRSRHRESIEYLYNRIYGFARFSAEHRFGAVSRTARSSQRCLGIGGAVHHKACAFRHRRRTTCIFELPRRRYV